MLLRRIIIFYIRKKYEYAYIIYRDKSDFRDIKDERGKLMLKSAKYNRIVIISSSDISTGAYGSHVISLLEHLSNYYDILGLFSFRKREQNKEEKIVSDRMHRLKNTLNEDRVFFFNKKNLLSIYKQKVIVKHFLDQYKNEGILLLCQNYYAGFLGSLIKKEIKNVYLHVDFKGIVPEEHLFYDDSFIAKRLFSYIGGKIFERYIFKHADSFSAVSNNFKEYFQKRYNLGTRPFLVLPSAVDSRKFYYSEEIREESRKKLGYDDKDIIITYSGSFLEWQQPIKIFEFFKQASNFKEYKFLILTFDVNKANTLAKSYNLPEERIKIFASSPIDVNGYLNASDICLLLRKDDIVNNVASPTKFGEYLVTKNKIIISKGVGDFSDIVENSQYGICLDDLDLDIDNILKKIKPLRKPTDEEINEFKVVYSIERNMAKLRKIIDVLHDCNIHYGPSGGQ